MSSYPVGLWRIPAPIVKDGKHGSLIVDSGELRKAIANSEGNYLFAESQTATEAIKPLAIIGTFSEIASYLIDHKNKKIINNIKGLDGIYIGLTKYLPGKRFSGIFPVHDFGMALFSQVVSVAPDLFGLTVPVFVEAAGIPSTLKTLLEVINKLKVDDDKKKYSSELYFLKISYLPEDGMITNKSNVLTFAELLNLLKVGGSKIK